MRGIPKEAHAKDLNLWRWLTITSTCQKVFTRCCVQVLHRLAPESRVCSYGFRAGVACSHIQALFRILLAKAHAFKIPLVLISADVKSAFASITISELIVALTELNIPALLQVALLAELEKLSAEATVADAPASRVFEFSKGGREGGVDTPSLWYYFLQWLLEPVVAQWELEGIGFRLCKILSNDCFIS